MHQRTQSVSDVIIYRNEFLAKKVEKFTDYVIILVKNTTIINSRNFNKKDLTLEPNLQDYAGKMKHRNSC